VTPTSLCLQWLPPPPHWRYMLCWSETKLACARKLLLYVELYAGQNARVCTRTFRFPNFKTSLFVRIKVYLQYGGVDLCSVLRPRLHLKYKKNRNHNDHRGVARVFVKMNNMPTRKLLVLTLCVDRMSFRCNLSLIGLRVA